MPRLFLIPHAQATHHIESRVGGWFDSELTPLGHSQADSVANYLETSTKGVDTVYTSDLTRAKQTAKPIVEKLGVKLVESSDLREVGCGIAEGKPQKWLDERISYPPGGALALDHTIIEGAETRRVAATRVSRFVSELMSQSFEQVVIVSHGFSSSFLIAAWLGMPVEAMAHVRFELSAAGITTLDIDSTWHNQTLVKLDYTSHLSPG